MKNSGVQKPSKLPKNVLFPALDSRIVREIIEEKVQADLKTDVSSVTTL